MVNGRFLSVLTINHLSFNHLSFSIGDIGLAADFDREFEPAVALFL